MDSTSWHERRNGWPDRAAPDDEISLFDLWDVLLRHRWLIIGIAGLVTAAAVTYALSRPTVYPYRSAIDIGSYVGGSDEARTQFLENPAAVRHKLEQAYVPSARKAVADGPEAAVPRIDVRAEGIKDDTRSGSGLFVLYTEASPEIAGQVQAMHRKVVANLEADHERLLAPIEARQRGRLERSEAELAHLQRPEVRRSRIEPLEQAVATAERKLDALDRQYESERLDLENRLAAQRRKATELQNRQAELEQKLQRVDRTEALLKEQLASQRELLMELEQARADANRNIQSSVDAMTMLAVDTQLGQARNRADNIQQRLQIGLEEERSTVRLNLLDNELAQENVADQIASLENKLANLDADYERERAAQQQALATARTQLERGRVDYQRALDEQKDAVRHASIALQELSPTSSLFVAERDLQPAGTSGKVIAALGVILGGMLGVFAAFAVEFVQAAQRRHVEEEGGFPAVTAGGATAPIRAVPDAAQPPPTAPTQSQRAS